MLKRIISAASRKLRNLMMAETTISDAVSQSVTQKRVADDGDVSAPDSKKLKVEPPGPMQGRADRKRKVALLIAYCGAGYYGIQIQKNGDFKTIESEIIKALVAAELIPQEHADVPQKMSLQRAARTDKNVSAVGNVLSLKMVYHDTVADTINTHLPPGIRIVGCMRTTRGFDSKNHCTARTYKYMLPTYSFAPVEKFITKDYRLPDGSLQRVKEVLGKYVGTHNFHNFTSGRKPNDPSSKRYIMSFECGDVFVRDGIEFVVLTVKGQSFMLHHIRKMIGLMIAIVRGYCGDEVLTKSWGPQKMDIPKAPGLGLFLEELFFAGYNKKFGNDGMHQPLVWDKYKDSLEAFKEEHVLSHIAKSEVTESVMLQWLSSLQYHTFDVIDPKEEVPPDGENEKDPSWWKTKSLLRKLDKEKEQQKTTESTSTEATAVQSETSAATLQSEATAATSQSEASEATSQSEAPESTPQSEASEATSQSEASEAPSQSEKSAAASQSEASSATSQSEGVSSDVVNGEASADAVKP